MRIYMEISVPNTLSMSQVIQILKSHSASAIFQKISNFMKLYPSGSFWGGQYSNHSVGPTDESTIKNYIRRQDVSNVDNQTVYSIKTFGDTADLVGGEDPNEKVYKGEALMSLCSKAI